MKYPATHTNYTDPFFMEVARPMFLAWSTRKVKDGTGLEELENLKAEDWKLACLQWIARRERKH